MDTLLNEITIQNSINKSSTVVKPTNKRVLGIALAQKKNTLLDDSKCFKQTTDQIIHLD